MRTAALIFVAVILYLSFKEEWNSPNWLWFLLGGAIFLMIINAGNKSDRRGDQGRRDVAARRKADMLKAGSEEVPAPPGGNFILFLRPFPVDAHVLSPNPRKDALRSFIIPFYRMAIESTCSFDDAMAFHLRDYGELIAIGRAGEQIGASRVTVGDENWRDYFFSLARHARALVFIVGLTESTLWEFEQAWADPTLRSKTVLLLPPTRTASDGDGLDPAEAVAARLETMGVKLPVAKSGQGFVFAADGAIRQHVDVVETSWRTHPIKKRNLRHLVELACARPAQS